MRNLFSIILAIAVVAWIIPASFGAEHGGKEHGGKEHAGKEHAGAAVQAPSNDDIRSAMQNYVTDQSKATGTFEVMDSETGKTRKLNLERVHDRVGKTGDYYYSCADFRDTETGQLLDLALDVADNNGTLSVADVRIHKEEGKERYYSRKMPLQKIENDTSKEELASEQLLLEYLFNSKDHLFNPQSNWANNATYKDGKMVHFDFGEDADNFLRAPTNRDSLIARLQFMSPETIAHLKEKLSELHERFAGEEGKEFFRSIIAASAAPATEVFTSHDAFEKHADLDPVELLHMVLMGRIEGFKKTLDKMGRAEQ